MVALRDQGSLFILSSPSGGGKSSLAQALLKADLALKLSISVTTRFPRIGEVDGINYIFKTLGEFEDLIQSGAFLEYAKIYDNYYGTLQTKVEEILEQNYDLLFDIDYQGMRQIKAHKPSSISIFIMPPSIAVLEKRLRDRGQDSEEIIKGRLAKAEAEMTKASEYDHIVINDDFEECLKNIQMIINSYRARP